MNFVKPSCLLLALTFFSINSNAFFGAIGVAVLGATVAGFNGAQTVLINRHLGIARDSNKMLTDINNGIGGIINQLKKLPPSDVYRAIYESTTGKKLNNQDRYELRINPSSGNLSLYKVTAPRINTSAELTQISAKLDTYDIGATIVKEQLIQDILDTLVKPPTGSPLAGGGYLEVNIKKQIDYVKEFAQHLINREQNDRKNRLNKWNETILNTYSIKESIDLSNILELEELASRYEDSEIDEKLAIAKLIHHLSNLNSEESSLLSIGKTRKFAIVP